MGALERGERNLSFHNLVLVSKALGITLSQLLSGYGSKSATLPSGSVVTGITELVARNYSGSKRAEK
jgi:hypothetical protein